MMTAPRAPTLVESRLRLPNRRQGKVRDIYDLPANSAHGIGPDPAILIVASDRISAFDVVMPTPIPGKGRLLTALSTFWLRFIQARGLCRTHLITDDAGALDPSVLADSGLTPEDLAGRVTIARWARVIPIECVARGYLEGSGWKEYQQTGFVCGVRLPAGLRRCDRLPEPIFTPATKEESGRHDQNISFAQAAELVGQPLMQRLRDRTMDIHRAAADHALRRGVIIADTKFEFGLTPGSADEPILVDEALTPDSSRFWPAADYAPGRAQRSFDKQYLREHLESLVARGAWNKQAPGPALPDDIVTATAARYEEALRLLTA